MGDLDPVAFYRLIAEQLQDFRRQFERDEATRQRGERAENGLLLAAIADAVGEHVNFTADSLAERTCSHMALAALLQDAAFDNRRLGKRLEQVKDAGAMDGRVLQIVKRGNRGTVWVVCRAGVCAPSGLHHPSGTEA